MQSIPIEKEGIKKKLTTGNTHNLESSFGEFIDNSIEANATIITILFKDNEIIYYDNGIGMDEDILLKCITIGDITNKIDNSISKYGYGFKEATQFLMGNIKERQCHIFSKQVEKEDICKALIDYTSWTYKISDSCKKKEINIIKKYLKYNSDEELKKSSFSFFRFETDIIFTNDLIDDFKYLCGRKYYNFLKHKKLIINFEYNNQVFNIKPVCIIKKNQNNYFDLLIYYHNSNIYVYTENTKILKKNIDNETPQLLKFCQNKKQNKFLKCIEDEKEMEEVLESPFITCSIYDMKDSSLIEDDCNNEEYNKNIILINRLGVNISSILFKDCQVIRNAERYYRGKIIFATNFIKELDKIYGITTNKTKITLDDCYKKKQDLLLTNCIGFFSEYTTKYNKARRDFSQETKRSVKTIQNGKSKLFEIPFNGIFMNEEYDHIDGDNSNNSIDNCQILTSIEHSFKTRNETEYNKILLGNRNEKQLYFYTQILKPLCESNLLTANFRNNLLNIIDLEINDLKKNFNN